MQDKQGFEIGEPNHSKFKVQSTIEDLKGSFANCFYIRQNGHIFTLDFISQTDHGEGNIELILVKRLKITISEIETLSRLLNDTIARAKQNDLEAQNHNVSTGNNQNLP